MIPTLGSLADGIVAVPPGAESLQLRGVALDSRRVRPGFLFAALPGSALDGRRFIADALARGAAAVLLPEGADWPEGVPAVPVLRSASPSSAIARIAARAAGPQPARIAAVTGTNGKTSTADFVRQLWQLGGLRAASIGTLGVMSELETLPDIGPVLTTPDSVGLATLLAALRQGGTDGVAIEASSHGLEQHRLDGVSITAAGFSNLSRDHLDYHGTLERYRDAKLALFERLLPRGAPCCVNADMDAETLGRLRAVAEARGLSWRSAGIDGETIRLREATPRPDGQILSVSVAGETREIRLALPGRFQADNVLLALVLAASGEDELPALLERAPRLKGVRGRMELAATLPNGAGAYVDYAHTPDALERLLRSLRPHAEEGGGRLVAVFGAGGDRDRGKRPLMGEIASRLADLAIVTDDNPRSEEPGSIRRAILDAAPGAIEIGDRREAIAAGLEALRPGDVLVVAGKGHEQGQIVGKEVLPFDDASVVRALAGVAA
ncbi:UDP-N-acetylmuramoyl-L-alanyl-D-glutamate--2,6-diaminopimelate ligase [Acetobacteraceae bacterium KSS8]|uniref:UDP-N-acetylmuramoyl-L-alanyl-D-glutamate--2,6-diaminopimelate ligase n=1 Tax=Endosaccharibacter trunci TaxID=2812733 RepID=A0ABT1W2V0_9PROT|nr:UDP-N-acetylmuramoyl-L-alanyl-D-glutamate--2,6-diaminopimelate ligase [Acetobacteraceae bacterium KSS8]